MFHSFRRYLSIVAVLVIASISGTVHALLIDRGGGLIYDDVQDITWLQDANYAMTSGYDDDGRMTWDDAMAWASNLEYGGFSDWRLPTTLVPDPTCLVPEIPYGSTCTGGEMSHLYNVDMIRETDSAPFFNLYTQYYSRYWSSTEIDAENAHHFLWMDGYTNPSDTNKSSLYYAWAVRDGDIAVVPEPATFALMGIGLAGLGFFRRRK